MRAFHGYRLFIALAVIMAISFLASSCAGDEIEISSESIIKEENNKDETPSLKEPGLAWSANTFEVVYGDEYVFPALTNNYSVKVTYASSNPDVATVSDDGSITIISAGTATISASSSETSEYEAGSASYTLTVSRASGGLEWSADTAEAVYGEDTSLPEISNPNNLIISWSSSDEQVAAISAEGVVSIIGSGVTTISASSAETGGYEACEASYILTVKRAQSGLGFNQSNVTTVIGQDYSVPTLINPNGLTIIWSSSDENVAAVSSDGTISIIGAGSATISASSVETSEYEAGSVSFTITISKSSSTVAWSESVCSVKIGEDNTFPSLSNPGQQEITYSSSDESVASISPDGTVILKGAGTVTITATAKENASCVEGSSIYTLEVAAQDVNLENAGLAWSESSAEISIISQSTDLPTLSNPNKLNVTYTSSSPTVAIIFSNGAIMPRNVGTTTITASSKATDVYEAGSASYILTVTKEPASISWPNETYTAAIGGDNSFPTLENPFDLDINYSSSNNTVASVSSDGSITLNSPGTTTITASTEAITFYEAGSASYTLTVTKAIPSLAWSANSATMTLGSDNVFPELTNPDGLPVTFSSSNTSVATIDSEGVVTLKGGGLTTITATFKENESYSSKAVSYKLTVNKQSPTLSWSESEFTAYMDETNSYPTLDNPSGLSISYSSSNTSVAAISESGEISLNRVGTTTITAGFNGDNQYNPASVSFTLNVMRSQTDDGSGTFTFSSTGDKSSDDDISNTTFKRMITITYSTSGDATVTGDYYGFVTIDGNKVSVNNNRNDENIIYKLTGATNNGYFKLASEKKQAILLDNASITNPNGAAINNQSGKRTFVVIEGSNTLSDGSSASYSSGSEDMKAVLFSEGQLVFSGDGSLTVNAVNKNGKSGILSDDYVRVMSDPTIKVISGGSAGHGVKGNDYVIISSGTLNISTAADTKKGIASDDYVLIEDGSVTIKVTGGVKYDSEDREYSGTAGIKADNYFGMTGGVLEITNTGDGGKGIRAGNYNYYTANKTLGESYISGGEITITTSGKETNDVSSKAIKIGFKETISSGYSARYLSGGDLNISGGKMILKSSYCEALEIKGQLAISGGEIYAYSQQEDAINSQGEMSITGGYVYSLSEGNDAIDSNGNIRISGGIVYALTTNGTPEVAIDAATESGYKVFVESGATIISYGGIEPGASLNQTCYTMSVTPGGINALIDENGKTIAVFKAPTGISSMVVSAPSLKSGIHGVTASGGSTKCEGYLLFPNSISGGEASTLKEYTPTSIWGN